MCCFAFKGAFILLQLGFRFHHTKTNYVVVVKPLTVDNNIPKYAYTNIGVGRFDRIITATYFICFKSNTIFFLGRKSCSERKKRSFDGERETLSG